jgi:hypothetical protein
VLQLHEPSSLDAQRRKIRDAQAKGFEKALQKVGALAMAGDRIEEECQEP